VDPHKRGFALRIALEHARYAEQREARAIVANLQQQTDQGCQFAMWLTSPGGGSGNGAGPWGHVYTPKRLPKAERDRWAEMFEDED